ncbi:trypsin-like peptidase domain-containing protein [Okeania sp. SIO1I7]|uniref:trypsin-like peptidase domain-containing protein n=1 Tax=Okeania sp. SIO1I7 TaxID=2607772 RepID=UPI0013FC5758|nr:trypsin-like peptidase domain-containing protein [Okeania sp. SIO1I7]NET26786.1 TIR domain-containing protein [Okeania sp. SIO1I7]
MEFLKYCTVKLSFANNNRQGTGFFVAPGFILTCAHVVKDLDNLPIQIRWQQEQNFAEARVESLVYKFDLALLKFNPPKDKNLPCVYLGEEDLMDRDGLHTFGYPDRDYNDGCPAKFFYEGIIGGELPLIKFQSGQIISGMSGSALVNERTKKVCGVIKSTRDNWIDLGGDAIPTSVILSQFPELRELNQQFHQQDQRWIENMEGTGQTESKGEPSESQDGFIYDAYISYVDKEPDAAWVWETLVPKLEDTGLKIAISGDVDSPGVARVENAEIGIKQSKRTVLVLSATYLADSMDNFENILGQTLGIEEGSYRLLPLKISEIDRKLLPIRLSMLTTLNLIHPRRAEREFTRLITALKSPLPKR